MAQPAESKINPKREPNLSLSIFNPVSARTCYIKLIAFTSLWRRANTNSVIKYFFFHLIPYFLPKQPIMLQSLINPILTDICRNIICASLQFLVPVTHHNPNGTFLNHLQIIQTVPNRNRIFHAAPIIFQNFMDSFCLIIPHRHLYAVSDVHSDAGTNVLDNIGLNYTKAVMYRTVSNNFGPDEPFDYDMLIFFSPSGIDSLMKNFPDFNQGEIVIGCLGQATAQAVEAAGLRLDFQAGTAANPSIVNAIEKCIVERNGAPE